MINCRTSMTALFWLSILKTLFIFVLTSTLKWSKVGYQVVKNQANAMGFCLSLDKLVCFFSYWCVHCVMFHTDKRLLCLEENMAVPPFCSFHFSLISTLLEQYCALCMTVISSVYKDDNVKCHSSQANPPWSACALFVLPLWYITLSNHMVLFSSFASFCLNTKKSSLYFWGLHGHLFVKGE